MTPVEVHVSALSLETYSDGLAQVRLTCSSGFYVRSLAHDLGQRLGCGAHLEGLRRTALRRRSLSTGPSPLTQSSRKAPLPPNGAWFP